MDNNKNSEHRTTNNTELHNTENITIQVTKPCVKQLNKHIINNKHITLLISVH
jgi:hypothetical protein